MRIITARVPGATRLARLPELSRMARQRLKWMDYYRARGRNATSMVGRSLSSLKRRGVLREPLRTGFSTRKRLWRRPYAMRKPKGYAVEEPGDLVQVDALQARMPFPVQAIQVDGGSEFQAAFETECQQRGIRLFVLPPRFPQAQWLRGARATHPYRGVL